MKTVKKPSVKKLRVEKVAAAIEADAGRALPGLRESLAEAKAGRGGPAVCTRPSRSWRGVADARLAAWPL